jgi:DNA-binding CsgD family transcriptional regulator
MKELTKIKRKVLVLTLQGKTQIQVANQLGIHQAAVHKLLMGNIDYATGKRTSGIINKMR